MLLLRVELARPGGRENGPNILNHMLMLHPTITKRPPLDQRRAIRAQKWHVSVHGVSMPGMG
jgi:hypothetical protein